MTTCVTLVEWKENEFYFPSEKFSLSHFMVSLEQAVTKYTIVFFCNFFVETFCF